jgi:hypothetical protein
MAETKDETPAPLAWEQQTGEPDIWYDRFHRYMLLGPRRTIQAAAEAENDLDYAKVVKEAEKAGVDAPEKKKIKDLSLWRKNARNRSWDNRAKAYDAEQRRMAESEQMIRQLELLDKAQLLGLALYDKVRDMLKFPLQRTKVEKQDEHTTIIVEPADWSLADAVRLAEASVKMLRMGAGIEEVNNSIQVAGTIHNGIGQSPSTTDYGWLKEVTGQNGHGTKQIESRISEESRPVQPEQTPKV